MIDHLERAQSALEAADTYANRDGITPEHRAHMVDYRLRIAQVEATIAVAQRLDTLIGLAFDEGRAIHVAQVRAGSA